jgi:hypothetical protein
VANPISRASNAHPDLFAQLASERTDRLFARLEKSARQIPHAGVGRPGATGQQQPASGQHHGGARRHRVAVERPAAAPAATAAVALVAHGDQPPATEQAEARGHERAAASVSLRRAAIALSARQAGA